MRTNGDKLADLGRRLGGALSVILPRAKRSPLLLAAIAVFSHPSLARGGTIPGYDVLAVASYCERFLAAPKLPAMSTLMATFGDPLPCVERRIQQGDLKIVQIDLIDATCWRNGTCPPDAPRPDDLGAIKRRARRVYQLASRYPSVEFWLSPALEHDVGRAATVTSMLQAAQSGCPSCKVINSPFRGATPAGYRVERHGTRVSAFSVSGDGASSFDGDNLANDGNLFQHRASGTHTTFAWWPELNLRCTGEEAPPPPDQRTARPSADQFRQAFLIMQRPESAKPPAPPQCRGVRDIEIGKEIVKPNAEAYCNGQQFDPRGNKPLLILKDAGQAGQELPVLSPSGAAVGCFRYWGSYSGIPGTHRWYMGNCSGQAPTALYSALGGEWGFAKLPSGRCVRFNAIRRQGVYR